MVTMEEKGQLSHVTSEILHQIDTSTTKYYIDIMWMCIYVYMYLSIYPIKKESSKKKKKSTPPTLHRNILCLSKSPVLTLMRFHLVIFHTFPRVGKVFYLSQRTMWYELFWRIYI